MQVYNFARKKITESGVIILGAGISLNSGIPVVYHLKKKILQNMKVLEPLDIEEISSNSFIPFESFMETLKSETGNINGLLKIFKCGKPNINHLLIANLAKEQVLKVIITTNFDTLIEQAFEQINYSNYKKLYRLSDFNKINWNSDKTLLIKIHGCISDTRTIATTLERVSGRNGLQSKRKVIQHILDGNFESIPSIGYSYSDVFDINPEIQKFTGLDTEFIYINYSNKLSSIESIDKEDRNIPLKKYPRSNKVNLDIDKLIKHIWKKTLETLPPKDNTSLEKVKKEIDQHISRWTNQVGNRYSKAAFYSIAAKLFSKRGKDETSKKYSLKAIQIAVESGNIIDELFYKEDLMVYFDSLKLSVEQLELANECLSKLEDYNGDGKDYFRMVYNGYKGSALDNLSDYEGAMDHIRTALELAIEYGHKQDEALYLNSFGSIYLKTNWIELAQTCFKESELIFKRLGDPMGLSIVYTNQALLQSRISNLSQAIYFKKKSLKLSEEIGNLEYTANDYASLAHLYAQKNKLKEADDLFLRSHELHKEIEDKSGYAILQNNYGAYKFKLKQYAEALALHKSAVDYFIKSNDLFNLTGSLSNLGKAEFMLGNMKGALKLYLMALEFAEKIRDSLMIGECLFDIGEFYELVGKYEKAQRTYIESHKIFMSVFENDNHEDCKRVSEKIKSLVLIINTQ